MIPSSARIKLPEPYPFQTDDSDSEAVLAVAAEIDLRRSWREKLRDAVRSVCLLFALLRHRRRRRD